MSPKTDLTPESHQLILKAIERITSNAFNTVRDVTAIMTEPKDAANSDIAVKGKFDSFIAAEDLTDQFSQTMRASPYLS